MFLFFLSFFNWPANVTFLLHVPTRKVGPGYKTAADLHRFTLLFVYLNVITARCRSPGSRSAGLLLPAQCSSQSVYRGNIREKTAASGRYVTDLARNARTAEWTSSSSPFYYSINL